MNLLGVAGPVIAAVLPPMPVTVLVSAGSAVAADGTPLPAYATPGALVGSIGGQLTGSASGTILTVTAVASGSLQAGDLVSGTDGLGGQLVNAEVLSQASGTPGGIGTYNLAEPAGLLGSAALTATSTVLNVASVPAGVLQVGQTVAGPGVAPSSLITSQVSGSPGGAGLYELGVRQVVPSASMTTSLVLLGSVQPMSARDLRQLEGLNVAGVQWKVYLRGEVDSIVRPEKKGGDLVVIPSGPHAGTWLITVIVEQYPDWCAAGIVLQNGA